MNIKDLENNAVSNTEFGELAPLAAIVWAGSKGLIYEAITQCDDEMSLKSIRGQQKLDHGCTGNPFRDHGCDHVFIFFPLLRPPRIRSFLPIKWD